VTEILEGVPGLAQRLNEAEAQVEAGAVTELDSL
jgi:hypothetical protein